MRIKGFGPHAPRSWRQQLARGPALLPAAILACSSLLSPCLGEVPDAGSILDRALARAQTQREAGTNTAFLSLIRATTFFLDGDGGVARTERETYRQYAVEGEVFEELVAREGQPLSEAEVRKETRRREAFAGKVRQRRAQGQDGAPEDPGRVSFDEEFVSRYRVSIAGEETVEGHPSWILLLEPREGDLPVRRQIDHALNHATGRVWVSQRDYGIPLVRFEMNRPVRFWGGILGTLRNSVGKLEFQRVDDGVWLPSRVDIQFDLRILFRNIRRRVVREWDEYVRVSEEKRWTSEEAGKLR